MKIISEGLIKKYQGRNVVNNVSLELNQGEIVGLLGPNGAGKTTCFYMLVGIINPGSGKIFLDDQDITKMPMYQRAKFGIGYLPQEASIFRELTVEENILASLEMMTYTKKERYSIMQQLLEEFSITHIAKSKGKVLSGGERRRTEIARLLTINPKFILLDEPFAGVDPIAVEEIQNLICQLKNKGIGILITDHNVDETLSITDRAYLIYSGELLYTGTPQQLVSDEKVKNLYLGKNFELKTKNNI